MRLQKEEVAKQMAMKTNKKQKSDEDEEESESSGSGTSSADDLKVGDFVRSTFAEDGVDYEAEIVAMTENGTCTIRYIGYGNQERVKAEELVASWGPEAREEQRILAEADQQASSDNHNEELHQFVVNKSQGFQNSLPIPPMVRQHPIVSISCFTAFHYLLQPPMPPAMFDNSADSDYMSAMLMSWYMSGYYTGLYHGRKQAREEIQSQTTNLKTVEAKSMGKETPSKKKKSRKT